MSENLPAVAGQRPDIIAGNKPTPLVPNSLSLVWEMADMIAASGLAPKGMDTKEKISVAIMHGLEVGFTPMMALQSIAVINGRPSIWGDGALGLIQSSGLLEKFEETMSGTERADNWTATCKVKRKGHAERTATFTWAQAKAAKLTTKDGPWLNYPHRMMQMRARAFALRDNFADVLKGFAIAEEQRDIEATTEVVNKPPLPDTPPAPPVDAVDAEYTTVDSGAERETSAVRETAPAGAAAGSPPGQSPPQQSDGLDGAAFARLKTDMDAAFAKATTEAEITAVWRANGRNMKACSPEQIKAIRAVRKPHEERVKSAPAGDAFSLEKFLADLKAEFDKCETFDALNAAYERLVTPAIEAGQIDNTHIDGPIGTLHGQARDRIEYGDEIPEND